MSALDATSLDPLARMLTRLKLTAIRDTLDSLLDEAAHRELSLREALVLLCEREIARKDERRIEMGLSIARLPFVRDLASFDFAAQPSLDPRQIRELATGRFVASADSVLLLGPPGVGKTHLAVAIGREVILAGYSVLFTTAPALVAALAKAHAEGKLEERHGLRERRSAVTNLRRRASRSVSDLSPSKCFPRASQSSSANHSARGMTVSVQKIRCAESV